MNSANLIGRITKNLELKKTENGTSYLNMFIAINNGKDENGNDRQADFPKIYVYHKQAENVAKYCNRGSLIAISGQIKTRTWKKEDGSNGYETYVLANKVQFLDAKHEEQQAKDPFNDFENKIEVSDEELPF